MQSVFSLKQALMRECRELREYMNLMILRLLTLSRKQIREEQAIIEGRIQELEYMIEHAVIISEEVSDTVKIGSSVVIRYDGEDDTEEYKIVGSTESDPFENKISNESPIAKALLGKKKGSKVTVESPNGKYDIELVDIK